MFPVSGSVQVLGNTICSPVRIDELRKLHCRIGQVFRGLHLMGRDRRQLQQFYKSDGGSALAPDTPDTRAN